MNLTPERDAEFCDTFLDVSKTEKRLIRASVRTYNLTGTYVTLKLFKKDNSEAFLFNQKVTLSLDEFDKLAKKINRVRALNPKIKQLERDFGAKQKTKSTRTCSLRKSPVENEESECAIV